MPSTDIESKLDMVFITVVVWKSKSQCGSQNSPNFDSIIMAYDS